MLLLIAYRCNTDGPNTLFVPTFNLSQIRSLQDFKDENSEQIKKDLQSNMNNKAVPFNEQKFTYLCRLVALRQNQYAQMNVQSQVS